MTPIIYNKYMILPRAKQLMAIGDFLGALEKIWAAASYFIEDLLLECRILLESHNSLQAFLPLLRTMVEDKDAFTDNFVRCERYVLNIWIYLLELLMTNF